MKKVSAPLWLVLIALSICMEKAGATPEKSFCRIFDELIAERETKHAYPPVSEVAYGGRKFKVASFLGRATSQVFRSEDRKHIIKFYDLKDKGLAWWEYWTTLYYRENGIPVAQAGKPFLIVDKRKKKKVVVVKEYLHGLRSDEFQNSEYLEALHLNPDRVARRAADFMTMLKSLHQEGRYLTWLKKKGVDIQTFDHMEGRIHKGDIKEENLLLKPQGFAVIDP